MPSGGKVATALNLKDTPKDYADFINMCKAGVMFRGGCLQWSCIVSAVLRDAA